MLSKFLPAVVTAFMLGWVGISSAAAAERGGLTVAQGVQACIAASPSNDHDTMMLANMNHLGMQEEIVEFKILQCQLFMSCLWRQGSISYDIFLLWRDHLCYSYYSIF